MFYPTSPPLRIFLILTGILGGVSPSAQAATPAPPGAEVYLIHPRDGDVLESPLTVRFGLRNMGIAPAGVQYENTGHHHLLVDTPPPPGHRPIPSDAQHLHFGRGQTETTLELPPGQHTLRLLLGDHHHIPHDPPVVSTPITITIQ